MTLIGAASVYYPIPPKDLRIPTCFCLATASGVMTYVSLVEVFGESKENFIEGFMHTYGEKKANTYGLAAATGMFFLGWVIALGMDCGLHKIMDKAQSHHNPKNAEEEDYKKVPIEEQLTEQLMNRVTKHSFVFIIQKSM